MKRLRILTPSYYALYAHSYATKIFYYKIDENELDIDTSNASVAAYSFMLEGKKADVKKYLKYKSSKKKSELKEFLIIDDIVKAYEFAQKNDLTKENILKAHTICSKNLLPQKNRGKCRTNEYELKNEKAKSIFLATNPDFVEDIFSLYGNDINVLFSRELRLNQSFYYAAYLHIGLLHISPFVDANGIMARLIEKWFLSKKLDNRAWFIPSEEYYFNNRDIYFENISKMGDDYRNRNYELAQDFVLMLPKSLEIETVEEE